MTDQEGKQMVWIVVKKWQGGLVEFVGVCLNEQIARYEAGQAIDPEDNRYTVTVSASKMLTMLTSTDVYAEAQVDGVPPGELEVRS